MEAPKRHPQLQHVQAALTSAVSFPLFLHGPPTTGKNATLTAALPPASTVTHIDCVLSHTPRLLFSAILDRPATPDPADLIHRLSRQSPVSLRVIIFDRAERLSGLALTSSHVAFLFRLPHLANRHDIRLVFLSRVPWPVFRTTLPPTISPPISIFFPPYSESEATEILSSNFDPSRLSKPIPKHLQKRARQQYPGYIRMVVTVLYTTTCDVHELQRVADDLYPAYLTPVDGCTAPTTAVASFNRVRDGLTHSLHRLYRRERVPRNVTIEHELMKRRHASATPHSDLGRSARTLLVAAYLASHNLAAHDMRYFSTERTRRSGARGRGRGRGRGGPRGGRGRGRGVAVLDGASLAVCRVFPLERLLAIFCAIRVADDNSGQDMMDESVCMSFSTSCLVQISTLVSLNYLSKEGGGDGIAEPKYRCNVSQEQAFNIAKTLDITLQEYMDI